MLKKNHIKILWNSNFNVFSNFFSSKKSRVSICHFSTFFFLVSSFESKDLQTPQWRGKGAGWSEAGKSHFIQSLNRNADPPPPETVLLKPLILRSSHLFCSNLGPHFHPKLLSIEVFLPHAHVYLSGPKVRTSPGECQCKQAQTWKEHIKTGAVFCFRKGGSQWLSQACVIGKHDNIHTKSSLFRAVCE